MQEVQCVLHKLIKLSTYIPFLLRVYKVYKKNIPNLAARGRCCRSVKCPSQSVDSHNFTEGAELGNFQNLAALKT